MTNIASVILWISSLWMVVKLFREKKGVLHGILGLLCGLYPLIWGIIHFKDAEYGVKNPMILYFVGVGLFIVFYAIGMATGAAPQ